MIGFNYSGQNGDPGTQGADGKSGSRGQSGYSGQSGTNGTNGISGMKIDIKLASNGNTVIVKEETQNSENDQIILGDTTANIHLHSIGGEGGKGGRGGEGGRGGCGYSGSNATQYSNGTDGGPGYAGGSGGRGGNGGEGGDGGNLTVSVSTQDMDLLMLIGDVSLKGGAGGVGGQGGYGGSGGSGGAGGSSYTWTDERGGTTTTYSNPGGNSGPDGPSGSSGDKGTNGKQGKDGTFYYFVQNQRFPSRYDLKIQKVEKFLSSDGIIEPEESMQISMMEIENIGGMPTPAIQSIILSLDDNKWVNFNPGDAVLIPKSLPSRQMYFLERPLRFMIKDNIFPVVDGIFKEKASIDYRARVERVNKEFQGVALQNDFYELRYPVEMSEIQILRAITPNEESPFAISIWNRSSLALGSESKSKRLLNFRLMIMDQIQSVQFTAKDVFDLKKQTHNGSLHGQRALDQNNFIVPFLNEQQNPIIEQVFIPDLPANKKKIISGTIKLKELNLPLYTKIHLQAKLDLGYIQNPENTFQNIQTRNFHIQLTERHIFNVNSDFLLVFNCDTSKELIDSFKYFANSFGSSIDLWNISNYQGFAFDFTILPQNKPFNVLYKNKVIVILANQYNTTTGQKTNAVIEMREAQIFKAAKQCGISIYIIADSTTKLNQFYLLNPRCKFEGSIQTGPLLENFFGQIQSDKQDDRQIQGDLSEELRIKYEQENLQSFNSTYTYSFVDSLTCCTYPKASRVELKAKEILKKLETIYPSYSQIVSWDYKLEYKKSNIFSKVYSLGSISTAESLRKDTTSIIQRRRIQIINELLGLDQNDVFALLKLLPFERKLTYIDRVLENVDQAKLLFKAILADLCDEYLTFVNNAFDSITNLQLILNKWTSMLIFPFKEKFENVLEGNMQEQPVQGRENEEIIEKQRQQLEQVDGQFENQGVDHEQDGIQIHSQNINIKADLQGQQYYQNPQQEPLLGILPQIESVPSEQPINQQIKDHFISVLIRFKTVMFKQLSFGQKYCCCCPGSSAKVTKYCLGILQTILSSFNVSKTRLNRQTAINLHSLQSTNKHDALLEFQKPYFIMNKEMNLTDEIILNNHQESSKIIQRSDVPEFNFYEKENIYIQQDSFTFSNEFNAALNEKKRQAKIERFEDLIVFEN